MRKEAQYQRKNVDGSVECLMCPRQCVLQDGEIGSCRTRKVIGHTLYSLSYGNPCSIHVDPVEKKPLFHFYPGSNTFSLGVAGCVLHCQNCQNYTISQTSPSEIPGFPFPADVIVRECIGSGCDSISYTYTDPFAFYEYTEDIAKQAKLLGIKNILVTSGYINEEPLLQVMPLVDAANVDIKCFSNEVYKHLCGGTLEPVLRTLKMMRDAGVWLEITNLLIPGWTDDMETVELMCGWLAAHGFDNTPLHFSRFAPIYKLKGLEATPHETIEKAIAIARRAGLKHVYAGNVINGHECSTLCPDCGTPLVNREGFSVQVNTRFHGSCPECGCKIAGRFEP